MEASILWTIIYFVSTLAFSVGFFLLKKSEDKLYAATWIPVTMLGLMGYQTMIAAVMCLVAIPINLISVGIMNLVPAIAIWIYIIKNKKIQKYKVEKADIAMWIVMLAVIVKLASIRFTLQLIPNYNSLDAVAHFTSAMDVVNNQNISTMFFAALHNGILIEFFAPFVSLTNYCKIYVLGDILYLLLSGLMFWGLIRKYCKDNFTKLAGMFATVMYFVAYPLNSTLFGFSYMGLGVTVIGFIITVADIYISKKVDKKLLIVLLSCGCVSIFQAYVLYMPVVFFALLTFLLVEQHREKRLFSGQTIGVGLGVFLLPTVIGLWYTYRGIFMGGASGTGGTTVGSAIAVEGGIYGDLFSNFILLIPLTLFAWWMLFKNKKNSLMLYLIPMELIFVFGLFVMALLGKVSAYYFYKNYYVMWLLFVFMAVVSISYMEKQAKTITALTTMMWLMLVLAGYFQYDEAVIKKNYLLHTRVQAESVGDIYMFNRDFLFLDEYSTEKIELYRYVNEDIIDKKLADKVYIASNIEDQYWYNAITNQRLEKISTDSLNTIIDEQLSQYVVVISECNEYTNYQYLFEAWDKVYETEAGYIVKLY